MGHGADYDAGHVWRAVGPNAGELWNQCANCRANQGSTRGRLPCPARVPHVSSGCGADGCYCPEDVFWARMLGDDDPCAPGKDWGAAAFGSLDDD